MGTLAMGAACEKEGPPQTPAPRIVELTNSMGWVFVDDPSQDAFADMRPADVACDPLLAALPEHRNADPVFELDTDNCSFITVEAETETAITPEFTIGLKLWHDALTASEPAEAYMALAIDGNVAWETTVPIPSDPALLEEDLPVDHELPEGTVFQFHIHNHGNNAYDIFDIMATRPEN